MLRLSIWGKTTLEICRRPEDGARKGRTVMRTTATRSCRIRQVTVRLPNIESIMARSLSTLTTMAVELNMTAEPMMKEVWTDNPMILQIPKATRVVSVIWKKEARTGLPPMLLNLREGNPVPNTNIRRMIPSSPRLPISSGDLISLVI